MTARTPAHREWWASSPPRQEYGYFDVWGAETRTAWKLFGGGLELERLRLAARGAEVPGVRAAEEFLGLDKPWPAAEEYLDQLAARYPGPPPRPEPPRYETEEEWKDSPWFHDELFKDGFPKKGVPIPLAHRLFELKEDEVRRREITERGPGGLIAGAGRLVIDLVVSATDPINIGAMFIPVVGQVRAARMIARFGRRGGRFLTGAIEGTVGTALVEPHVLQGTKMQQADYGMVDSLLAIGLGGPLGGGLHVGLGALGDRLARAVPHTREAALKSSVARMADGRRPMADQVIKLDEQIGREIAIDETLARQDIVDQVRHAPEDMERRSAEIEKQRVRLMEEVARDVEMPEVVEVAAPARPMIDWEVKPAPPPEKAPEISAARAGLTPSTADSRAPRISPEMATPEQIAAESAWAREEFARLRAVEAPPAPEARGPYSEMAPGSKEHRASVREAVAAGRTVPEEHLTPYREEPWAREALEKPEEAKGRAAEAEKAATEALWEVAAAHWKERQVSANRWEAKFAERYRDIIETELKPEMETAEAPMMIPHEERQQGVTFNEYRRIGSTWPEWAGDRGWTKKQVVRTLDKLLAGEKMGRREIDIAHGAVEESRERIIMEAMKTLGHSEDPEMARLLDEYVRLLTEAENAGADPRAVQAAEEKLYGAYRSSIQGARQEATAAEMASTIRQEEGVTEAGDLADLERMAQEDVQAERDAFDALVAADKEAVVRAQDAVEEPIDFPEERLDDQYAMDPDAAAEADAQLRELPETTKITDAQRDFDDLMSELDEMVEQGALDAGDVEAVRRLAADAKVRGDDYADSIRRAANCLTMRG